MKTKDVICTIKKLFLVMSFFISCQVSAAELMEAVKAGKSVEEIEAILKKGPKAIKYQNKDGYTPLHLAAEKGHKEIAEILIHRAAKFGYRKIAAWLKKTGTNSIEAQDQYGWTPLHRAAEKGHREIAEMLIAKGVVVDAQTKYDYTPLHGAVRNGHREIAEMLIAKGAVVDAQTKDGYTPLHLAAEKGHREIAEMLIAKGAVVDAQTKDGATPLHGAARNGHRKIAEMLIVKGAVVDAQTKDGATPLHMAVWDGHRETVEMLIAKGAKLEAQDKDGFTPLHVAEKGHREIAEMLIVKGAVVDAQDENGYTPLHLAAQNGHREVAEMLIAQGAVVDAQTKYGSTPLYRAAEEGHKEIVEMLLKASVYKAGQQLKEALSELPMPLIHLIIQYHANMVNMQTNFGETALHVLCKNISQEKALPIALLLLDCGADVLMLDNLGKTPIDYAQNKGYTKIVKALRQKSPINDQNFLLNWLQVTPSQSASEDHLQKKTKEIDQPTLEPRGHKEHKKQVVDKNQEQTLRDAMIRGNKLESVEIFLNAIHAGNNVLIESVLAFYPALLTAKNMRGFTPLHSIVSSRAFSPERQYALVEQLLLAKAHAGDRDNMDRTPLSIAQGTTNDALIALLKD